MDENIEDDAHIEDLTKPTAKKRVNCSKKGKAAEREVVHILNDRFFDLLSKNPSWGMFSRSVGSGNRWGQQVVLSSNAKEVYAGDLTCPTNFKFSIENKKGYPDIDLCAIFDGKCKGLDGFLNQTAKSAKDSGRKPLLLWKKDRKPRLAFILTVDLKKQPKVDVVLKYNKWTCVNFNDLLKLNDGFFFSKI